MLFASLLKFDGILKIPFGDLLIYCKTHAVLMLLTFALTCRCSTHDCPVYPSNDTIGRHCNFHVMIYFVTPSGYLPAHYCSMPANFDNLNERKRKHRPASTRYSTRHKFSIKQLGKYTNYLWPIRFLGWHAVEIPSADRVLFDLRCLLHSNRHQTPAKFSQPNPCRRALLRVVRFHIVWRDSPNRWC